MVNSVSNEQAYLNAVMAKLPDVEQAKEYSLKKGDSLWSLAKKCLNDKNASNAKTTNYMLLIAKLNNLDTVEKMNGLKAGQKIYLPDDKLEQQSEQQIKRNDAETTFLQAIKTLQTDQSLKLEKANMEYGECYHLFKKKQSPSGYGLNRKLMLSFDVNSSGEINTISMDNANQDLYSFGYDYDVDQNGNIIGASYPHELKGKLSKDENNILREKLLELMKNYNKE